MTKPRSGVGRRTFAAAALAAMALAGCSATVTASYPVAPALPPELVPLPPVTDRPLIWEPGDWVFEDGKYRFSPGHYVDRGGHPPSWVFAHWEGTPGHYLWVPGAWARP